MIGLALAWIIALGGLGCTEAAKTEQCLNEDSPPVAGPPDTALLRARVTIESLLTVDATGGSTVSNTIRADLVDITAGTQLPRKRSTANIGSPGCYGLTGRPVCSNGQAPPCPIERLDADRIEVSGLGGGGVVTLDRTATKGSFKLEQLKSPLFAAGPATATITGRKDKGFFPSMSLQVPQPALLDLKEPVVDASGKPLGSGDVKTRWTPGTADLIAINASLSPPKDPPDDLQCIVVDDGCTTLLHGDLDSFDMTTGSKFELQVIRDNTRIKTEGNVSLEVKAISRVKLVLAR